jgi:hypothetical protein
MTRLRCTVPNLEISTNTANIQLIEKTQKISLTGSGLSAILSDGQTEDTYDKISKQIRIIYSFCFEEVYPESYDIEGSNSISLRGHDERKEHLLSSSGKPRKEFIDISTSLFDDLLKLKLSQKNKRQLFNLMFVWAKAKELEELSLFVEAYAQYWRILDLIQVKGSSSTAKELLENFGLDHESKSNIAAAKIEKVMRPNANKYSKQNIETISYLYSLRHPHAHKPSRGDDYYLEKMNTHLEAEINNIFISDITKLYVLWSTGLKDYYLKPRANIYELAKK